jgi:hypothetical protein
MSLTFQDTPEKVYYDVTITNLQNVTAPPPVLYFNETRNNPFVIDPESYYLSIIRFTLDTPTLPVIQPEIQPNQANRDLTVYSVTLTWDNPVAPFQHFEQQTFVVYEPQDLAVAVPAAPIQQPNKLQNNGTGYYDIYNYQYFIYLVNKAFTSCYNDLSTAVTAAGLALPSTYAPVMSWNIQEMTAVLNADVAGYDDSSANYIKIYFNPSLYQLFSSFPITIESFGIGINGKNVRINTNNFGGTNTILFPPVAPVYTALQVFQEYSTVALWTPVTSVVFTSNTLPVVPNNISAPLLFLNGAVYSTGGNNSNISQVITDFVSDTGIYKPNIVYTPTAQYRLINLVGNQPLYNLDISVYYKDRVGNLVPFRLSSGSTATIKLLFSRKGTDGTTKP